MTEPQTTELCYLADLAQGICSRAAVYKAYHRGQIGGVIRFGDTLKQRPEAQAYHRKHGWGKGIEPWYEGIETASGAAA